MTLSRHAEPSPGGRLADGRDRLIGSGFGWFGFGCGGLSRRGLRSSISLFQSVHWAAYIYLFCLIVERCCGVGQ